MKRSLVFLYSLFCAGFIYAGTCSNVINIGQPSQASLLSGTQTVSGNWTFTGHTQLSTTTIVEGSSATFTGPVQLDSTLSVTGAITSSTFTVDTGSLTVSGGQLLASSNDSVQFIVQPQGSSNQIGQMVIRPAGTSAANIILQNNTGSANRFAITTDGSSSVLHEYQGVLQIRMGGTQHAYWIENSGNLPGFRFGDTGTPVATDATFHIIGNGTTPVLWVDEPDDTHLFEITSTSITAKVPISVAILDDSAPRTNLTSHTTFQFIINTGASPDELCISTGTTATTQWVLASNLSTACSN